MVLGKISNKQKERKGIKNPDSGWVLKIPAGGRTGGQLGLCSKTLSQKNTR